MRRSRARGGEEPEQLLRRFALLVGLVTFTLAALSLPLAYANGLSALQMLDVGILIGLAYSPIGAFVAWRQPRNAVGWLLLCVGLSQALVSFAAMFARYGLLTSPDSNLPGVDLMSVLSQIAWWPGFVVLVTLLPLLFPDGKLPSRRWRPIAWLSGLALVIFPFGVIVLWPRRGLALVETPNGVASGTLLDKLPVFPFIMFCAFASLIALLLRYRRSEGVGRQQIKWFAYAVALTFGFIAIVQLPAFRSGVGYGYGIGQLLNVPIALATPVAVAIAVLRYRLWDIDVVIRRTLVYAAVTALLALVFYGSVLGFQRLFTTLTGQTSPVALVASTLVIAALFSPLRRRVQDFVDRRFYRRKYDAGRVVSEFALIARDETDIERLTTGLQSAVEETMRPSSVSIWLTRS